MVSYIVADGCSGFAVREVVGKGGIASRRSSS